MKIKTEMALERTFSKVCAGDPSYTMQNIKRILLLHCKKVFDGFPTPRQVN